MVKSSSARGGVQAEGQPPSPAARTRGARSKRRAPPASRAASRGAAGSRGAGSPSSLGLCTFHGKECMVTEKHFGQQLCKTGLNIIKGHHRQLKLISKGKLKQDRFDWVHRPAQWRADNRHLLANEHNHMARHRASGSGYRQPARVSFGFPLERSRTRATHHMCRDVWNVTHIIILVFGPNFENITNGTWTGSETSRTHWETLTFVSFS